MQFLLFLGSILGCFQVLYPTDFWGSCRFCSKLLHTQQLRIEQVNVAISPMPFSLIYQNKAIYLLLLTINKQLYKSMVSASTRSFVIYSDHQENIMLLPKLPNTPQNLPNVSKTSKNFLKIPKIVPSNPFRPFFIQRLIK